ncbi:hypothetical protein C3V37_01690 [Peptostreptococcaceae bacterium oral taxon 929]|nr:hypothetical protein C3V37_01690 [Peptostreptococcaceae bacterium oral taxon 929]
MIAIVDRAYYDILRDKLNKFNIKVYPSFESKILKGAVATHPDMSLFKYDEDTLIASRESFDYYNEIFKGTKINIINANEDPHEKYPSDVKFNALRIGEHLICKRDVCAKSIIKRFDEAKIINSSQGYVKCSIIDVGSEYFASDDKYLYEIIKSFGKKCILLDKGFVKIKDYDYGFVGGASGYARDKIFLTGKIINEANRIRLEEFAREINKELIYLTEYDIFDIGTLMIMEE